ncbi:MAG: hypothetical protein IPN83_10520 [Holophagales bacterium]|nr:hypothetical protein [Holophagales bacterium]
MKLAPRTEAAVVVLTALVAGLPLLAGRVLGGHDVATYLMYAPQVAGLLGEGTFLPAWAAELNGGFGGPGLLFYPPLVNVPHALLLLAGIPPAVGTGLVAVALLALSGLAVLAWMRAWGLAEGALAAALVYVASPYRLVDLYERTALSEHLAFLFPPLVLAALASARPASPLRRTALVALAAAGLLLSNLPAAILTGVALAAVVLFPATGEGRRTVAISGALLGAGLAAFALVPAALSGRWCATELFYSGGSPYFRPSQHVLFGPAELNPEFGRRVSWAVVALAALLAIAFVAGRLRGRPDPRRGLWGAIALVAFLALLPPAGPAWDVIPVLSKLQFPWRLATVLTLALPPLVALAPRRAAIALVAAGALASVPWYGRFTAPLAAVPAEAPPPAAPGTAFPDPQDVHDSAGRSAHPWMQNPGLLDVWFVPRTVPPVSWREVVEGSAPSSAPSLRRAPVASRAGPVRWNVTRWDRLSKSATVEGPGGALLIRQLYFPGFRVEVDGAQRPVRPDPPTGLLSVEIPAGRHDVAWSWTPFGPLPAARAVSAAAAAAVFVLLVVPAFLRRRPTPGNGFRQVSPEAPRR